MCAPFREIGETCGFPTGDGLCRVFVYQTCKDVEGTMRCVAPQIVGEGADCGFFSGLKCNVGLRCMDHDANAETNDQCVVPLGVGEECDEDSSLCDQLLECHGGACQYGSYTGMCPASL
jgi:hypothetical protein